MVDLGRFLRLAGKECCNFQDWGPFGIRAYCFMEPKRTGFRCLLTENIPCRWFDQAVIRAKSNMIFLPDWERTLEEIRMEQTAVVETEAGSIQGVNLGNVRACLCGARFVPGSNRQIRCPVCRTRARKKSEAERQRKRRVQGGSSVRI
jgi:hypothetical protein